MNHKGKCVSEKTDGRGYPFLSYIAQVITSIGLSASFVVLGILGLASIVITCENGIGASLSETLVLVSAKSAPIMAIGCLLIVCILSGVIAYLSERIGRRNSLSVHVVVCCACIFAFQLWWINSQHSNGTYFSDSRQLLEYGSSIASKGLAATFDSEIASKTIDGLMPSTKYLVNYPFQSGVLLYFALIYRMFGQHAPFVLQLVNAISNTAVFALLVYLTHLLFDSKKTTISASLLGVLLTPLYLYSSFFYGNSLGLFMSMVVVTSNVIAMKSDNTRSVFANGVVTFIFLVLTLWIKSTYLLLALGLLIIWVVKALSEITKYNLVALTTYTLVLLVAHMASAAPQSYIEAKLGYELGDGMPKASWIAIGLDENSILGNEMPGWWNGSALERQIETSNDFGKQTQSAMDSIVSSLDKLLRDPGYGLHFFARKIATEWLTPDFQARYFAGINTSTEVDSEGQILERQFNVDSGESIKDADSEMTKIKVTWAQIESLLPIMDATQSLVYLASSYGCAVLLKQRKNLACRMLVTPCFFFVGFFVFLLWEAKAQYLLTFYVLLIPLAAFAIRNAADFLNDRFRKESLNGAK